MPAYLVGPVMLPITEMTLFCDRCLQRGHLIYGCPNDVKYRRCKENGHTADKCVYLQENRVSQWKQQRADNPTDKMDTNPVQDAVDTFMTSVIQDNTKTKQRTPTDQNNDSPTTDQPDATQGNSALTNSDSDKHSVMTTNASTDDDSTTDGQNTSTNTEDNSTTDSAPSSTPNSPDVQETKQWGTQQKGKSKGKCKQEKKLDKPQCNLKMIKNKFSKSLS